jgi:DNA-binding MarR family transcriptional regulator
MIQNGLPTIGDKKTNTRKQSIGINNTDKEFKSKWAILTALSDGQWHRNKELKEKTKLSSRTLDKHLDKIKEFQLIERKTNVESGKYAVFFRAKPELTTYYKANIMREESIKEMEKVLNERKDPFLILDAIHTISQRCFIELLEIIQQNKNITKEEINFFGECFLWTSYKQYISKLIEESRKIITDININQLLLKQFARQIEFCKKQLKKYGTTYNRKTPNSKEAKK